MAVSYTTQFYITTRLFFADTIESGVYRNILTYLRTGAPSPNCMGSTIVTILAICIFEFGQPTASHPFSILSSFSD
jgi:hypothetical protein